MTHSVDIGAAYATGPYEFYAGLREHAPVFYYEPIGAWVITKYADVVWALKHPAVFSHESFWDEPVSRHDRSNRHQAHIVDTFSNIMMYKDGEAHAKMRQLHGRTFAPPQVRSRRAQVEQICRSLLTAGRGKGSFDFVHDFAAPLPSMVVADYLGIPAADREWMLGLADRFSVIFEPALEGQARSDMLHDVIPFADCLDRLIHERRAEPQDDLISRLVAVPEENGGMSHEEVLGNLMHLVVAGNETTTNLLEHMIVHLTRLPELRAQMADNPDLITAFVEETLRFEAPIQIIGRKTKEEVTIGGQTIPAGVVVALGIGSANRDQERFPHPDVFDPHRLDKAHLSFAVGPHFCIGAPLARLEAVVALEMLTGEFNDLVLDPGVVPEWKTDLILRGFTRLGVHYAPSA
ncbi:cytochrome P450 [Mycobacterium sp. BMJ-28]